MRGSYTSISVRRPAARSSSNRAPRRSWRRRTTAGPAGDPLHAWPVGPHLLVQATELLPPMSAAEQRSSGMSIPDPDPQNEKAR